MGTPIRQTSFAGGELSPTLAGRSDLAKYKTSLRRMRNAFVSRQGAYVSRAGTTYVADTKLDATARLVPFVYADNLAYVLEFGNTYFRVYDSSGNYQCEVATSYAAADIFRLKFAQVGAVLTVTHPSYPPAEITYTNATTWAIANVSFAKLNPVTSGLIYAAGTYVSGSPLPPTAWNSGVTYPAGAITTLFGMAWESVVSSNVNHSPPDPAFWAPVGNWVGKAWQWAVTVVVQTLSGQLVETLPYVFTKYSTDGGVTLVSLPSLVMVNQQAPVALAFSNSSIGSVNTNIWGFRFYRGQGGVFGWVGDVAGDLTPSAAGVFVDQGNEPDYTIQPPQGLNPFVPPTNGSNVQFYKKRLLPTANDYPATVGFLDSRRIFAGTPQRPDTVFGSEVNDFYNFDDANLPTESSPFQFTLAAMKYEQVRSVAMLGPSMIALTQSSVWSVAGTGGPLADGSVDAKRHGDIGASWLSPLVIDAALLFARTKGTGVRSVVYDQRSETFINTDLTIWAEHLFLKHQIVDWCYAEDPYGTIWAVREDGLLVSITYVRDQEVIACSWHDSPGGTTSPDPSDGAPSGGAYESVCSVPNGLEDVVFYVVRRTIGGVTKRFIEKGSSRVITDENANSAVLLDASTVLTSPSTTLTGLDYLDGQAVYAVVDGAAEGPFTVVGGSITLSVTGTTVIVGLAFWPELELLDAVVDGAETRLRLKQAHTVGVEMNESRGVQAGADFEHLSDLTQREVSDEFESVEPGSDLYVMTIDGDWNYHARVAIRGTPGLPLTIYGITRKVDIGDD